MDSPATEQLLSDVSYVINSKGNQLEVITTNLSIRAPRAAGHRNEPQADLQVKSPVRVSSLYGVERQ